MKTPKIYSFLKCFFDYYYFMISNEKSINFNIKQMRKQTGSIYFKDLSKSPSQNVETANLGDDLRTVRKQNNFYNASISIKNSQCSDSLGNKGSRVSVKNP